MEMSSFKCLADLGMGDPFPMHQWPQVESIDDLSSISIASIFSENYNLDIYQSYDDIINSNTTSTHQAMDEHGNLRPSKQVKRVKNNDGTLLYSQPSGTVLNFSSPQSVIKTGNQDNGSKMCKAAKGEITGANGGRLAQDHTMAERKRREKLSQRFIALSTLVPGLKKMDKASILGDAITHIKQLQEKVKGLEEQTRKKTMESVVFVMKFEGSSANSIESSSSDKSSTSSGPKTGEWAPEIGARFSDREVLVNILCMKRKGIVEKTVAEIEKLHLSVVNSSVISFGDSALNITVCAQKDEEFNTTMEDLVKKLLGAVKLFM